MQKLNSLVVISVIIFSAVSVKADSMPRIVETDWLKAQTGSSGGKLGAEVTQIERASEDDVTIVDIELPIDNPGAYESIEVIDKNSNRPLPPVQDEQWLETADPDTHGLRLYLKKRPGFEFRLRLIDAEPEG